MIFDTHAHYDDEAFNEDREQLIEELKASDIKRIVNVGANLRTSKNSVDLSEKYDLFYAAVGVHPDDADEVLCPARWTQNNYRRRNVRLCCGPGYELFTGNAGS